MKKYYAYIGIDLKVAPSLYANSIEHARFKFEQLSMQDLLSAVVDVSTIEIYSVR